MSILDTLFGRPGSQGHWDNVGLFGRLHTRTMPQMGCYVCEAEGWIPASKPASKPASIPTTSAAPMATCQESPDAPTQPDMDSTHAHLFAAQELLKLTITHLDAVRKDSRVDPSVCDVALDTLRDALTAVEAQMEAEVKAGDTNSIRCPTCTGYGFVCVQSEAGTRLTLECPDCQGTRVLRQPKQQ